VERIIWLAEELAEAIMVHPVGQVVEAQARQEFPVAWLGQQEQPILGEVVAVVEVEQFLHKADLVLLL